MDNGSKYISKAFQQFCYQLNFEYKAGILCNPQRKGIVECAHSFLKTQLQEIKMAEIYTEFPHNALNHALFI